MGQGKAKEGYFKKSTRKRQGMILKNGTRKR